ncbi:MAG: RNA-guided endonuclease InsQ/TnpB family protein [Acidithiobacillus ferrooxidans]
MSEDCVSSNGDGCFSFSRSLADALLCKTSGCSTDGTVFPPVTAYRHALKQLAREQRKLSGKRKFSANWKKQKAKITRLHQRIAELRKTILHQVSTAIISKNHAVVVLEDLNAANMTASAKGTVETPGRNVRQKSGLHKSILDQGWGMLKRMLEYKLRWRGGMLLLVNPALHVANLRGLQRGGRREPPEPGRVPLPALRSYGARRRERGKKYPRKRIAVDGQKSIILNNKVSSPTIKFHPGVSPELREAGPA